MARAATKPSRSKGQKSITSFFKGGNPAKTSGKEKAKDDDEDDEPVTSDVEAGVEAETEVDDAEVDEEESEDEGKAVTGGRAIDPSDSDLPPIHDIPAIFSDLVSRAPEIANVAQHLEGRKLRVATMCSGTESPLLALDLIRRSILDQYGAQFEFEHVFSCEIEPFKQAYIERNFKPPLLFRDVCELGDTHATTAYGALAPVPGDVDLLVAGTSCVDYSNLNNKKQDIDARGESGQTFRGMMSWVRNHRPPIVILENVCSAPWDRVVEYFEDEDYSAAFRRVDTKHFYIPHTRTRVYLVAVDKRGSDMPNRWKSMIEKMKRPASSTLDAFLLPSDDPRIHQAREKLVSESHFTGDRKTGRTDWGRCESRHQRARLEEELGLKRPLTSWDEGGFCKLPDFAWNDWGVSQVERVWDLMDISLLRAAKDGVDPSYKTQVWNLSQNVDRTIGSSKVGICPCLTPSMIPYITNRGGPMVGLEALSMQGLPVDELLLTRETEDQLADLAGNAMSTTVVGACIMSALIIGRKLLKDGDDKATYEQKKTLKEAADDEDDDDVMIVDGPAESTVPMEDRVSGEDQLIEKPLDLASTSRIALSKLLERAEQSARLCECEGRRGMTDRPLNRCQDCGSSSCVRCGGRPEHNYEPIDLQANPRISPSAFAQELKSTLPMSLELANVTKELLDSLKASCGATIPEKRWTNWRTAVLRAAGHELRFVEPKRQEIWSATYQSPAAFLELQLYPARSEWRFFAKPEDSEPANSELRKLLDAPVGRLVCTDGLFSGRWEFALPYSTTVDLAVEGSDPVPAWESRLGLQDTDHKDKMVHSRVEITVPKEDVGRFDWDISGVYTLLDKCGTANGALHKREKSSRDKNVPPIFFMMDPTRCGAPADDCFVFTISTRRYEFGETRPIICQLDPSWRQSDKVGSESVKCRIPYGWTGSPEVSLTPATGYNASFAVPAEDLHISVSTDACGSANAVLVCRVPLHNKAGPEWPRGSWGEIDRIHERVTYKALAWLTERIRDIGGQFNEWRDLELNDDHAGCVRCAPQPPELRWAKKAKKIAAIEDTIQAGEYERSLKRRPAPFVTQLKLEENGIGIVRIGVNIASLIHRAMARLPSAGRTDQISVSWRLDTDFTPAVKLHLLKFKISSNREDEEHSQPPSFRIPLRREQLRSLTWMLEREAADAAPFVEEEISEAVLEPLGWRAEGRAQRPVHIRGGVLADEVGYGKTAITLGLIDCAAKSVKKEFNRIDDMKGKIPTKATLVVVPPHLIRQWASEVEKFTGKRFKVISLISASSINTLTIEKVQEADIIVVASNLFQSTVYLDNLQAIAAVGSFPNKEGRYFDARLETILSSLRDQVERLKDEGPASVMSKIVEGSTYDDNEDNFFVPTKRLKGRNYRAAAEKATVKSKKAKVAPSKSPRTKMIVEVVVPSRKRASSRSSVGSNASAPPTSATEATEAEDDDEDSDLPKARPRRVRKKIPIVLSDDEAAKPEDDFQPDDDSDAAPKRPAKKATYAKRAKKGSKSSDYDEESAQESPDEDEDEDEAIASDTSVESAPKGKGKGKAKAKPKPPTKAKGKATGRKSAATSDDSEKMDIDEPVPSKGKSGTKRKANNDEKRPAKKQRLDTDPWGLKSAAVKRDWTLMKAPPLEMFHFARIVVDEYTYLTGKIHSMVTSLTADRRWVLSGTPPIHDFLALKTISAFLKLHLGVDDDADGGQSSQAKKRRRELTASETFHSFREVHTLEWHAHRHEIGQAFLDRFLRQNIAEISEIPFNQEIKKVVLPAAERAIYLELEHHLRALDMTVKRGKKSDSDREKRVAQALGDSSTAEEALLKRCSHFELEKSEKENAMKACEVIVQERTQQLDACKADLLKKLRDAKDAEKKIGRVVDESMFKEYNRVTHTDGQGDQDATEVVIELMQQAGITPITTAPTKQSNARGKAGKSKDDDLPRETKDRIWAHREETHEIRRVTKELVGRVRSLRYFTAVRDLQKQREEPPVVSCPSCGRNNVPVDEVAVLSSCGHMGCYKCVVACADREECVYAASGACRAAARVLNIVKGDTLGVDDAREGRGKHFGLKLEKVVALIKKEIPKEERVLIFVQFPDLMEKVAEALKANRVEYLQIKGSAHAKSKNLDMFQKGSKERVLLLNVMDESASGANLTGANHAIFLSPLLAPSQEIYDACETQAVGRLVRFGQNKHVKIWRFFSMDTIDVEIYEQRTKTKLA
ncbi:hypothetical protein B0H21DRAFT_888547 [Amylocystis lapponica]|nr:hypothetical protein B0H21DRAFT_888547 [Amylocystis lapponica]